jgi:hypothetical protein
MLIYQRVSVAPKKSTRNPLVVSPNRKLAVLRGLGLVGSLNDLRKILEKPGKRNKIGGI